MLALADDAALARLVIAAAEIPAARVERAFKGGREPPTRSRNAKETRPR